MPIYVDDILTDEKLLQCNEQALAIYPWILFCLHKQEAYGKILLKQKFKQNTKQSSKQTPKQIFDFASMLARLLPFDLLTIEIGLEDLIEEKVLILEGDYLIQKRMVRDNEISLMRSQIGKKGGDKRARNLESQAEILPKQNVKQTPKQNTKQNTGNVNEYEIHLHDLLLSTNNNPTENKELNTTSNNNNNGASGEKEQPQQQVIPVQASAPTPEPKPKKKKTSALDFPLPFESEEFKNAWMKFHQHRIEIGKPYMPTGHQEALKKCEVMGEKAAIEAIQNSLSGSYQGIFPPNTGKSINNQNDKSHGNTSTTPRFRQGRVEPQGGGFGEL